MKDSEKDFDSEYNILLCKASHIDNSNSHCGDMPLAKYMKIKKHYQINKEEVLPGYENSFNIIKMKIIVVAYREVSHNTVKNMQKRHTQDNIKSMANTTGKVTDTKNFNMIISLNRNGNILILGAQSLTRNKILA